jgi:uncharacterized protein (DUF1800 family)
MNQCERWIAATLIFHMVTSAAFADHPGPLTCKPGIDFNRSNISDLWEALYPDALEPFDDADGDGVSNIDELAAGTDPTDTADFLKISGIRRISERRPADIAGTADKKRSSNRYVRIDWSAVAGKHYTVERLANDEWIAVSSVTAPATGPMEFDVKLPQTSNILRLRVGDIDADGDGLSAWEEAMLGLHDRSPTSNGVIGRPDFSAAMRLYQGEGPLELADGRSVPKRAVSRNEVVRLMAQSTFGADLGMIAQVESMGIGEWLDRQLDPQTQTSTMDTMWLESGPEVDPRSWFRGWWHAVMAGEDQLRQRMAYALSQILVISASGVDQLRAPRVQATYYDLLLKHSLGNYRELLEDVTRSAQMGQYLSHLHNRKGDPTLGRFPDENYAREIMQLFTIGLWELNLDGSRKLDTRGQPIPTYDNHTIMEMARVFTGFGYGGSAWSFFAEIPQVEQVLPMKMWDEEHDSGEKRIIRGIVLPAGQSGLQDVADTLDALCAHPNIAPFLSRLLIQRLTSSNPSPQYVRRVATIWRDNGAGVSGDLKAVAEAILMDPEARYPEARGDASGKVREPYLRLTALLRAFNARNSRPQPTYPVWTGEFPAIFGQQPLWAPSVFNFYLPDHSPGGELRDRGLVAPELEIATADRLPATSNYFQRIISRGVDPSFNFPEDILMPDYTLELELAQNAEALVDHLDGLLTWGSLSSTTRQTVLGTIAALPDPKDRVETAIHLIVESPDFVVLK